jgi:dTDP-4-dehydrorhamnose reductase
VRVVLTGAGGQLGRALAATLAGHDVVALPRDALDITDLAAVRRAVAAHAPGLVMNAAAFNDVDGAQGDPDPAYRGNALGPRNLALATAEKGVGLLHVSSDYVFDGTSTRPYHEYDRPNPLSAYGASKLAGEEAVRALNPRHYVVRTAWLYSATGRNFPRTMLTQSSAPSVRVVDDQVGSPTYAPHLAAAIVRLVDSGAYGTYHLAGTGAVSWCALARALFERLGIVTAVEAVTSDAFPRPAPRPRYSVLTTLQDPRILLPDWHEGVDEFARAVR